MGELVAVPLRGAWCGNRGILHRGTDVVRFHASDLWITCALTFKDWRLPQWEPGHFTLLFFHDEAVSFAAGHRPCALCRRNAYNAYRQAVATVHATAPLLARDLDRRLHAERIHRGTHRRRLHRLPWAELPDGAFVALDDGPAIVLGGSIVAWTTSGYGVPRRRPTRGDAEVITPPTSVAALRGGYPLQVDETAFPG
ncbi:MAG: hypothetical protein QOI51_1475 [Nocardioidaceae bacterium]|nr:hypothetical protein [Nocardioidaceae bacterium]